MILFTRRQRHGSALVLPALLLFMIACWGARPGYMPDGPSHEAGAEAARANAHTGRGASAVSTRSLLQNEPVQAFPAPPADDDGTGSSDASSADPNKKDRAMPMPTQPSGTPEVARPGDADENESPVNVKSNADALTGTLADSAGEDLPTLAAGVAPKPVAQPDDLTQEVPAEFSHDDEVPPGSRPSTPNEPAQLPDVYARRKAPEDSEHSLVQLGAMKEAEDRQSALKELAQLQDLNESGSSVLVWIGDLDFEKSGKLNPTQIVNIDVTIKSYIDWKKISTIRVMGRGVNWGNVAAAEAFANFAEHPQDPASTISALQKESGKEVDVLTREDGPCAHGEKLQKRKCLLCLSKEVTPCGLEYAKEVAYVVRAGDGSESLKEQEFLMEQVKPTPMLWVVASGEGAEKDKVGKPPDKFPIRESYRHYAERLFE